VQTTEADPDWAAFTPTEETRELSTTAREHFAQLAPDALLHAVAAGQEAADVWGALADGGYPAIGIPEEHDGIGTLIDLVAMLEEAGRALLPAPLATNAAAAQTLLTAKMTPHPNEPAALAERHADGGLFAFDGLHATSLVVAEPDGDGTRVTRLTPRARTPQTTPLDASRPGAPVTAADTSEDTIVATSIDHVLAVARICVAADLVGTAVRAAEGSITHASTREQFGRPIGSFQAIKHRLADLYVDIERARSLVLGAAVSAMADRLSDETRDLSMLAKAAATETAQLAAHIHTQLLGAMGLTFDGGSQLEVRRARHTARQLGSAADLYARVGALRGAHDTEEGAPR
jgi:alkylation response protein AidB-like acyl-CoA dehydrogenase